MEASKRLRKRSDTRGVIQGMSWGIDGLDKATSGIHRGELVIIAGRPSMGKSALAGNILRGVCDAGLEGMLFTLEMSRADVMDRLAADHGNIRFQNIRIGVAISVIGTSVAAYSSYESGQSQKKAAEYNATMQDRAADDALNRGAADAAAVKERTRKLISTQIANSGAGGFDSGTGTALDLSTEAAGYGELDALKTINNAQRVASGQSAQATLDRFQGSSSARAGTLNAAGTLLSGAGSAGNSYYKIKTGRQL